MQIEYFPRNRNLRRCTCACLVGVFWFNAISLALSNPAFTNQPDTRLVSIKSTIAKIVRNIRNCEITGVNRGNRNSLLPNEKGQVAGTLNTRTLFKVWCSDQAMQFCFVDESVMDSEKWPKANLAIFPSVPYDSNTVLDAAGVVCAVREKPEPLVVDIRRFSPEAISSDGYNGLYTTGLDYRKRVKFFLPFIDENRVWGESRSVACSLNVLNYSNLANWQIVSAEESGNPSKITIDISEEPMLYYLPMRDPKRGELSEGDELFLIFVKRVVFEKQSSGEYYPVKLHSHRKWKFRNIIHDIEVEKSVSSLTLELANWKDFGAGMIFPQYGKECYYTSPANGKNDSRDQESIDSFCRDVIASIVSKKPFNATALMALTTQQEWYVHSLKKIAGTENLWIDPPNNYCNYNSDTGRRTIVGKSDTDSFRILQGITDGEPPAPTFPLTSMALFCAIGGFLVIAGFRMYMSFTRKSRL